MYAWKCWRDLRARFFMFLVASVLLCLAQTFGAAFERHRGEWRFIATLSPEHSVDVWQTATGSVALSCMFLIGLAALVMGGSGVGEEFRLRTLEFLLTRPRRRRSFVWVGWSVGLGLLLVMITSTVLLTFGLLATLTRQIHSWRIFLLVPGLFVGCAVLWTLAYFLTLVLRNGQNGTNWAIFLFLVYFGVSVYLFTEFRVELPSLFAIVGFVVTGKGAFLLNWGGWLTFAAALTPVGQFLFSRAEV